MNEIKKCIFDILDENGIYIDSNEMEEDLDLREYILDSLQYVYIIEMYSVSLCLLSMFVNKAVF